MAQKISKPSRVTELKNSSLYRLIYRHRYVISLLVLIFLYWLTILIWRSIETRPPHWDMARHLLTAENYLAEARAHNTINFFLAYFYYPPGLYWYTAGWMFIFGNGLFSAVSSNLLWVALLAASLYGIGRDLKRPRAGLFAGIFCLTLPLFSSVIKDFQIDAPLMALVAINLYALLRTRYFASSMWSVIYGVTLGLGMLVKWTFVGFALWPLAVVLVVAFQTTPWKHVIKNLALAIIVGYSLAVPWYARNVDAIRLDFAANGTAAGVREGDPAVASVTGLLWYPLALLNYYWHLPWLVIQIGSLISIWRHKLYQDSAVLTILASSLGGLLTFVALRNKDARYILPVFVGFSLLAGLFLDKLYTRHRVGALVLVAACGVSFLLTSFGPAWPPIAIGANPQLTLWAPSGYITGAPTRDQWCLPAAIDHAVQAGGPYYYEGLDTIWFNQWDISYYTKLKGGVQGSVANSRTKIGRSLDLPADTTWSCQAADKSWVWTQQLTPPES